MVPRGPLLAVGCAGGLIPTFMGRGAASPQPGARAVAADSECERSAVGCSAAGVIVRRPGMAATLPDSKAAPRGLFRRAAGQLPATGLGGGRVAIFWSSGAARYVAGIDVNARRHSDSTPVGMIP
jgi:hypothetical protein